MCNTELKKKIKTRHRIDFTEITSLMGSLNPYKNRRLMLKLLESLESKLPGSERLSQYFRRLQATYGIKSNVINSLYNQVK